MARAASTSRRILARTGGWCAPFALTSGRQFRPTPGPATTAQSTYLTQALQILAYSATLTDTRKAIAEYWKVGPRSETPPGHWSLFAQYVSARDRHRLDDDVFLFFALANAVFDAGIAAWDAERFYTHSTDRRNPLPLCRSQRDCVGRPVSGHTTHCRAGLAAVPTRHHRHTAVSQIYQAMARSAPPPPRYSRASQEATALALPSPSPPTARRSSQVVRQLMTSPSAGRPIAPPPSRRASPALRRHPLPAGRSPTDGVLAPRGRNGVAKSPGVSPWETLSDVPYSAFWDCTGRYRM